MVHVKVCCIGSPEEARMARAAGASALGLVAEMPSGPGVIADELIRDIAAGCPPEIMTVLLTARTAPADIIEHLRYCGTRAVQLVDEAAPATHAAIRRALPGITIIQVIHVTDEGSVTLARELATEADMLLLDSGRPDATVRELGGTGRTHDWSLSRAIVDAVDIPVFLAGGIKPENALEAVNQVRPYGLDICSGLRSDGRLAPQKLAALFETLGPAAG